MAGGGDGLGGAAGGAAWRPNGGAVAAHYSLLSYSALGAWRALGGAGEVESLEGLRAGGDGELEGLGAGGDGKLEGLGAGGDGKLEGTVIFCYVYMFSLFVN